MENEKLENQKIDENELGKVTGGYALQPFPCLGGIGFVTLNKEEQEILKKSGYLEHFEDTGEKFISSSKFEKAMRLLNKKGHFNAADSNEDIVYLGTGCESIYVY